MKFTTAAEGHSGFVQMDIGLLRVANTLLPFILEKKKSASAILGVQVSRRTFYQRDRSQRGIFTVRHTATMW